MSKKKNPPKVAGSPIINIVGTKEGDALKGDRIVMYARKIDHHKDPPIKYTGNHRGQWAKGTGDVICIIEKGILGGRRKEISI